MIIPRNCNHCQLEYLADTRELKRGNSKYCGRKCAGLALSKAKIESRGDEWLNEQCSHCNTLIHVTSTRRRLSKSGLFFCSKEHQDLAYSDPSIEVKPGPVAGPNSSRKCATEDCKVKTRNTICQRCTQDLKIKKWLNGDISVTWSGATKEPLSWVKRYLKETRGDACEACGFSRKRPDGTSKIQMDHIDGNYLNNLPENLRLLCPNCHDDTPTYGSRNKNSGRRYRLSKTVGKVLE